MKKYFHFPLLFLIVALLVFSCKSGKGITDGAVASGDVTGVDAPKYEVYPVGFYNLENLYHPESTDSLRDREFHPEGSYNWTMDKYYKKQDNMAYVLSEMAKDFGGLVAVGIAEVGNRVVLEDLLERDLLKDKNWQIVHYDSPDWRGIDVAFFYDPTRFEYVRSSSHPYPYQESFEAGVTSERFQTRDALLVEGKIAGEDVAIMVNHWPSRRGDKSHLSRAYAAQIFVELYDSLKIARPEMRVIMMGDLNDDPDDYSCADVLNAKRYIDEVEPGGLFNPMWEKYARGIGTLCYMGKWNLFDQIIVSENLLGNDYSSLKFYKAEIFNRDFLIQKEGRYKGYPLRTYVGSQFLNGYSDHFPSYIYLVKEKK